VRRAPIPLSIGLFVAACATAPVDSERSARPACDQSLDCFYERNIRAFQVLDDESVVVLVGRDECPFKVQFEGFFCDMSMSVFLEFRDPDGRICTWDRTPVSTGPFPPEDTRILGGRFPREVDSCRVRSVTPMTDDELLEAYATSGLTPPPPAKGAGQIQVLQTPAEPAEQGTDTQDTAEVSSSEVAAGAAEAGADEPEPGPPGPP
jgi:hypothetical protein